MKVCIIGLGSIGKRHLRNLIKIYSECKIDVEIHAFRKTKTPLESDIKSLIDLEVFSEDDLCNDYDITLITNPTCLHYDTIKLMVNKTKNMFIEKPLFDSLEHDINDLGLRKDGVYYVAGPLRFTRVIQNLRNVLSDEKVYSIRAICSSYLPDWRPNVDYRNVYSAKKTEGGGVSIDLIHEWDYITYLFGFPNEVHNLNGKYSHLEIDSEDVSIYIARYEDKLVEVHLDYFGRVPRREIELYTKDTVIVGDFINKKIRFSDRRVDMDFSIENSDMYMEEMKSFIEKVLAGSKGDNNIEHAYKVLRLANGRI